MTTREQESLWLVSDSASVMLFVSDFPARGRKLRLWLAACCGRDWDDLPPGSREALGVAERFADGRATTGELVAAAALAGAALDDCRRAVSRLDVELLYQAAAAELGWQGMGPIVDARQAREVARRRSAAAAAVCSAAEPDRPGRVPWFSSSGGDPPADDRAAADLLRDVFGNPFRPAGFDPAWLTPTAAALAAGVYADRAFDRLPILADALQDGGCEDDDILAHCRGPGPHARGCWVVDLVLNKT